MLKEKIYSSNCFALDWVIKAFADSAFNRQKSLWNKETSKKIIKYLKKYELIWTKDNQTTELRPKQNWKFKVSPQNQYYIPFPNFILAFESYQHLVDDYITVNSLRCQQLCRCCLNTYFL